jgi:hypothetical protein
MCSIVVMGNTKHITLRVPEGLVGCIDIDARLQGRSRAQVVVRTLAEAYGYDLTGEKEMVNGSSEGGGIDRGAVRVLRRKIANLASGLAVQHRQAVEVDLPRQSDPGEASACDNGNVRVCRACGEPLSQAKGFWVCMDVNGCGLGGQQQGRV